MFLLIKSVATPHWAGAHWGLLLGVLDIVEADVQDREQVDSREQVEAREREEEDKTRKQPTNAQTCDIMDGMWME